MSKKGFNKHLPKYCKYCLFGAEIGNDGEIACRKHGITDSLDSCRSYKYDPLKREPEQSKIDTEYTPEDFSIN